MNSNSIFTRRHAGADAAASVSAPAPTSDAAEDAFKNDPTATLEGVRGKDVTKAAKGPAQRQRQARRRLHPDA